MTPMFYSAVIRSFLDIIKGFSFTEVLRVKVMQYKLTVATLPAGSIAEHFLLATCITV
jgi:DNA topoisomerase IA